MFLCMPILKGMQQNSVQRGYWVTREDKHAQKSVSKIKTVAINVSVSATASVDSAVWRQVRARNPMMHRNTTLQHIKINHNNDEIYDIL